MSRKEQRLARKLSKASDGTISYSTALEMIQSTLGTKNKTPVKAHENEIIPWAQRDSSPAPRTRNNWNLIPIGMRVTENSPGSTTHTPWNWDFTRDRTLLIAGQPGTGKTVALNSIYQWLSGNPVPIEVIAFSGDEIQEIARNPEADKQLQKSLKKRLLSNLANDIHTVIILTELHHSYEELPRDSVFSLANLNRLAQGYNKLTLVFDSLEIPSPDLEWASRVLLFRMSGNSRTHNILGRETLDRIKNLDLGICLNMGGVKENARDREAFLTGCYPVLHSPLEEQILSRQNSIRRYIVIEPAA